MTETSRTQSNEAAAAADDKLGDGNKRQPRLHPYDEVSDAILEENRSKRPPRRHEYDEIDLERTMSKVNRTNKSVGGASSND